MMWLMMNAQGCASAPVWVRIKGHPCVRVCMCVCLSICVHVWQSEYEICIRWLYDWIQGKSLPWLPIYEQITQIEGLSHPDVCVCCPPRLSFRISKHFSQKINDFGLNHLIAVLKLIIINLWIEGNYFFDSEPLLNLWPIKIFDWSLVN